MRSRGAFAVLAAVLYLGAGALSTWPALRDARASFLAEGRPGHSAAAPGDHLQSAYRLWLPGHQLGRGERPWIDPYSFQPVVEPQPNFAAWPFGLVFWPLHALLGTVGAWNGFVLLAYVGCGTLALLWLRALGLDRAAALAGGLAFALSPYLAAQLSAGHLLAPTAMLLPLALWAIERRTWPLAAAALASIPLSGQVHLALGAIPFVAAYAVVRRRPWVEAVAPAALAAAAGVLVWAAGIRGSVGAGGRSFAQVERYSADVADFVSRDVRHGIESFVFLGWLLPLLALAGLVLLLGGLSGSEPQSRQRRLAAVLGLGALVPIALALGANTPLYEPLWRFLPGLRDTRVPERLMPIACLCLAALAALALDRVKTALVAQSRKLVRVAAAVAFAALIALDLRGGVTLFRPTAADEDNAAYAALRVQPPGRLLELPIFLPDRHENSVYLYYAMQAPRERPLGYATNAPPEADAVARSFRDRCSAVELRRLGVRYVAFHGVFSSTQGDEPRCPGKRARERARDGPIVLLEYP